MSPLMAYRSDEEERAFRRAVQREIRIIQRGRKHPEPLWKQCLSAVILAAAVWIVGEIALYVHGQFRLEMPASQPHHVIRVTSTPNGEHR